MASEERWLTICQVAMHLQIPPATILRWLLTGWLRGEPPTAETGRWRVAASEVERFVAAVLGMQDDGQITPDP